MQIEETFEMIKVVLVDDEIPALTKMKSLLKPYEHYVVCGEFTDSVKALEQISSLSPQVAFIDIAMPGMTGIELAAEIHKKTRGKTLMVFVTAHDQYALDAFDVWATDYLLKPVSRSRFDQTIKRLDSLLKEYIDTDSETTPTNEGRTMVRLFGKLEISGAKNNGNWRTAKVRELFAFFLHNRNRSIYRDTLLEALWEGMSPAHALSNLNTTNYYLRRQLEKSGSDIKILYDSGYYSIDMGAVICDADEFEKAESAARKLTRENLDYVLAGASLYRGRYLEDVKCTWADLERELYMARYVRLRTQLADYYLNEGKFDEAIEQVMLGLEVNRLAVDPWKTFLTACARKGDPTLFRRTRDNMRRSFLEYTGSEPPDELLKIM